MNFQSIHAPVRAGTLPVIRAEIRDSDTASALGITVTAEAPVLALCRELTAAGFDPASRHEAFRGADALPDRPLDRRGCPPRSGPGRLQATRAKRLRGGPAHASNAAGGRVTAVSLLLDAALAYAAVGLPVFPLVPCRKELVTRHGFYPSREVLSWVRSRDIAWTKARQKIRESAA
jgi:hypothetical protein